MENVPVVMNLVLTILDLPDSYRLTRPIRTSVTPNNFSTSERDTQICYGKLAPYLLRKKSKVVLLLVPYRKQEFYISLLLDTFSENLYKDRLDVRPLDFPHEVLNYAKPLLQDGGETEYRTFNSASSYDYPILKW